MAINFWHKLPAALATIGGVAWLVVKFIVPTPAEMLQTWIRGQLQRRALAYWRKVQPFIPVVYAIVIMWLMVLVSKLPFFRKSQSTEIHGYIVAFVLLSLVAIALVERGFLPLPKISSKQE